MARTPARSSAAGRKTAKGRPASIADLRTKLTKARARGMPAALEDRGRRILDAWLASAETQGQPFRDIRAELASGEAARKLAAMTGEQIRANNPEQLVNAACAEGCAFCCILLEGDGGLITEAEARRMHAALAPLAGQPDGRAWNANACAALDPDTRACRVYDARPTVCRSFLSVSVEACRINAEGGEEDGSGMLGNHLDYLAILALSRDVMKGTALVQTFALDELARATVEGADLDSALKAARHPTRELEETCEDIGNSPD
ncbi:YkgJ family cysteine cluster protein [Ferrimonas balearica]|nr:YkgJ family cysteine cluster protein [Ferrimonas balearica]